MKVYVVTKRIEAREWGEIYFEVVGVWPTFTKALEYLIENKKKCDEIKREFGVSETAGITQSKNYARAHWCYSDFEGRYDYKIEPVNYHER